MKREKYQKIGGCKDVTDKDFTDNDQRILNLWDMRNVHKQNDEFNEISRLMPCGSPLLCYLFGGIEGATTLTLLVMRTSS